MAVVLLEIIRNNVEFSWSRMFPFIIAFERREKLSFEIRSDLPAQENNDMLIARSIDLFCTETIVEVWTAYGKRLVLTQSVCKPHPKTDPTEIASNSLSQIWAKICRNVNIKQN